jgi:two-component system, sensor histidine kinase and response regulator
MGTPLRVLIIDDSEKDKILEILELEKGGFDPVAERIDTPVAMQTALTEKTWDVILADYTMPYFSGDAALELFNQCNLETPYIVVSGTIGEERAVAAMKAGASDYINKNDLPRLVPVVHRELKEGKIRVAKRKAEEDLQKSLERERLLRRIVETISQSFDIGFILNATAEEAGKFFQADRCVVMRLERTKAELLLRLSGQYCRSEDIPLLKEEDIPLNVFRILSRNFPQDLMQVTNVSRLEDYVALIQDRFKESQEKEHIRIERDDLDSLIMDYLQKYCIQSVLGIGIYYRGTLYGSISLQQCGQRTWTEEEVDLLRTIAPHIGVALYQTELYLEEQQARATAEIANRKKSEFLSIMTLELRTPLNAIIGYSEMMAKGLGGSTLTEKDQKYIHNVVISGKHLLDLINEVLDVSKIEAGRMELTQEQIEIELLIETSKVIAEELARQKNIRLIFDIQPYIGKIQTDPLRFKQILFNLLSNAIKFNREGGSVTVKACKTEDQQWFVYSVQDTGIGIPKDRLPELFQPFSQLDTSYARKTEGTGLGLALTKHLIEMQGGTISVESEEGVGSTFTVKLPLEFVPPQP